MAISYPLTLPSHTGIRNVSLRAVNSVAYDRSPFTFAGQVQANAGQMWEANVTLPPMKYADAEQWIAWLVSLRGQFGSFTMGDPLRCVARGSARGTDTVIVGGAGQTGQDLNIVSDKLSVTGYLKAGDYIQIGSGISSRLYKVLVDVDTNASGEATVTVWPNVRTAPSNGDPVYVENTVGTWRLSTGDAEWSVNEAAIYGISFSAMEKL